jgi:hypothetical protein
MLGLVLGLVHGRSAAGVDNKVRPKARYGSSEHDAVDEISRRAASESSCVTAGHARTAERLCHLAMLARDENPHRRLRH